MDNYCHGVNKSESVDRPLEVDLHQGCHGGNRTWKMNIGYGDNDGNAD